MTDRVGIFVARDPRPNRRAQKITPLRIVWGATLEYYEAIDFRPDDISYPPVQPV
jgi:hypothetical protein